MMIKLMKIMYKFGKIQQGIMDNVLDLCLNGKLDPKLSPAFNRIAFSLRPKFNELISEISKPFKSNIDWWMQGPSSRHTASSSFFHYFCCLYFMNDLIKNNQLSYDSVLVDSQELCIIINNMLHDNKIIKCKVQYVKPLLLKIIIRKYLKIPALFCKKIVQQIIAILSREERLNLITRNNLVLIDTYMIAGYTDIDRWYGTLWNHLSNSLKSETFFIPTIVSTPLKAMMSIYKDLRTNNRNFLIREDYLKISDIFFAFQYKNRLKKINIRSVKVLGYEISNIIQYELKNYRDVSTIIESFLTYRFIKRLKESGITVRLAIDWFEGQVIDKAWNFGFNKYYPATKTIGYRVFESDPFDLCSYPISVEREAGVLPDVMAVQGAASKQNVREFLPDLDVIVIPSFKSQHVWQYNFSQKDELIRTVLITLPLSLYSSERIFNKVLKVYEKLQICREKIRFVIKPHPAQLFNKIISNFPELPNGFSIAKEKSLPILLHKSHLLITEASSSSLEALACGIPVIIIEDDSGLTFDSIPKNISKEIVLKVKTTEQIIHAMQYFFNQTTDKLKLRKTLAEKIRADYFEPITQDGIDKFMDLDNKENKNI